MSSLSRLFAAVVTLSLIGLACATTSPSTTGGTPSAEDVANESAPTERPQTPLQKITAPEGFSVLFPGQPEAQRGKVSIPGGEVQTASWAINDPQGVLYSISTLDYPEKVVMAHPAAAFFNECKTGLVNKLKGTIKCPHHRLRLGRGPRAELPRRAAPLHPARPLQPEHRRPPGR
jgi:hypothetical protein